MTRLAPQLRSQTSKIRQQRFLSTATASCSFNVDVVTENYATRTEWAASNFGNKGPLFRILLPPPNVTGKLHLGHALTVAIEDSLCRHHRIKGGVAVWIPGFDHAGIATQSAVERKLWKELKVTRNQLSREEFIENCRIFSNENSQVIQEQLKRLGATLDWGNSYYTLDKKFSSAVTRAFCELHGQKLIYRNKRLVYWCPVLQSSLSEQEVERIDVKSDTKLQIPDPKGGKRNIEVGKMYTIRYPLENTGFIEVGTTRPETVFADVALAINPKDVRYSSLIGSRVRHPLLPNRFLPIISDSAVIQNKGTGVLKITPAHDFLDLDIASRHWETILSSDSLAETRNCIDDFGKLCNVPERYNGVDRFDARRMVVEELQSLQLLGKNLSHDGQISICSRTGDIIEPRLTEQWFMDTRKMYEDVEVAVKSGQIKLVPSFHEGKLFDWLKNEEPWCLSRQLLWGHQIPAYSLDRKDWIVSKMREEAEQLLGTKSILQDNDVLDTWFSSSLVPLVKAGWMDKSFDPTKVSLSLMETGWDILGFWVVRMIGMTMCLAGQSPFPEILLHGLIRDPTGRKMSKSLGNVIDPLDVLDGIPVEKMINRVNDSSLDDKEKDIALLDVKKRYPHGIPKTGADSLRFALLRHDVLSTDISLNVVDLAGEGNRFCNKLWNLVNYMEAISEKCPKQKEVDSDAFADRWIMSRLAFALTTIDHHMITRAPHLALKVLHQFILSDICDETTKKALWNQNIPRVEEIRTTLIKVVQPTFVQLSVFMPFVTEYLYEKAFRREAGSIYFDFPSLFTLYRDEELEEQMDLALAAVSAVRSIRQQLQLPTRIEFEGILVSQLSGLHDIDPVLSDLAGLRLKTISKPPTKIPKEFIPCNLRGSDDILALRIEREHRTEFIDRLKRLLSKVEQRREQFTEKAKKYQEIVDRDRIQGNVKQAVIEKNLRKAEQSTTVANNSAEEASRLKTLLENME